MASQFLQQSPASFLTLLWAGRSVPVDPDSTHASVQLHSTHQADVPKQRPRSHSMFGAPYRTLPAELCSTQGFLGRSDLVGSGSQCIDALHAFHVSCECHLKFSPLSVIHCPLSVPLVSNVISRINFQAALEAGNLQFACSLFYTPVGFFSKGRCMLFSKHGSWGCAFSSAQLVCLWIVICLPWSQQPLFSWPMIYRRHALKAD